MSTYVEGVEMETHQCGECHIVFAATVDFWAKRRRDRKSWFCPNGHSRVFLGKTEEQRLKEELERAQQMRDAAEARAETATQERERIAKAHKTMRKRVMNGVCPCCNRTFQNLMQHMRTEHPDFDSKKTLATLRTAFGMSQGAVAKEAGVHQVHVSLYERQQHVSEHVKRALEGWIEKHQGKLPA